jgi:hypothetical protein
MLTDQQVYPPSGVRRVYEGEGDYVPPQAGVVWEAQERELGWPGLVILNAVQLDTWYS